MVAGTYTVTTTPPPAGALANGTFTRTVTAGLATSETGGSWTLAGTAANYAVNSSTATITTAVRTSNYAYLKSVASKETHLQATLGFNRLTAISL